MTNLMAQAITVASKRANLGGLAGRVKPAGTFAWLRHIDGVALFAFASGTCFLFGYGQQRTLGIMMVISVLLANARRPRSFFSRLTPLPPELRLYSAWVLWAGLTGVFAAADLGRFWVGYRVLLQIFIMVWAAYAILRNMGGVDVVFLALMTGAFIQIGFVATGTAAAGGIGNLMGSSQRVLGITKNPNSLGFFMVWCVICALVFWYGSRRSALYRKPFVLAVIAVATVVLFASGSRKSTLAWGLLVFAWVIFARGTARGVPKIASWVVVGSVVLFGVVTFGPDLLEKTTVGRRFNQFLQEGGGDVGDAARSNIRYRMYVDGLKISVEHPVFGVGLNNFGVYFNTGQYSHSDYIEPLVTTGLVGFVLYQSFYFFLISRILRLLRVVRDRKDRYRLRVYLLGIMAIMVIGLGSPHYTNLPVFLLLTAFSVSTWALQRRLMQEAAFDSQWAWATRRQGAQSYGGPGRPMSVRRWT